MLYRLKMYIKDMLKGIFDNKKNVFASIQIEKHEKQVNVKINYHFQKIHIYN